MKISLEEISQKVKTEASKAGFSSCNITAPLISQKAKSDFLKFLDENYNGQMAWLKKRVELRLSPKSLWKEVKSVIVLGESYMVNADVLQNLEKPNKGNISVYARGDDYHKVVKKRLKKLANVLVSNFSCDVKVFVDTAPILEKVLANQSGIGWTGKHTNILSRHLGNWFFIGLIFTNLEMKFDRREINHCGSCRACIDICPTEAFLKPYQLDARKCISYLTIEHKGPIDINLRKKMGNRIYGCDDCLAVCPWNKFAKKSLEIRYVARGNLKSPNLKDLILLDDASFREKFSGSPIKRIGRESFVRNALYAAGNSKDQTLLPIVEQLIKKKDDSNTITEAATWAKGQLKNGE